MLNYISQCLTLAVHALHIHLWHVQSYYSTYFAAKLHFPPYHNNWLAFGHDEWWVFEFFKGTAMLQSSLLTMSFDHINRQKCVNSHTWRWLEIWYVITNSLSVKAFIWFSLVNMKSDGSSWNPCNPRQLLCFGKLQK